MFECNEQLLVPHPSQRTCSLHQYIAARPPDTVHHVLADEVHRLACVKPALTHVYCKLECRFISGSIHRYRFSQIYT